MGKRWRDGDPGGNGGGHGGKRVLPLAVLAGLLLVGLTGRPAAAAPPGPVWVGSWAAAQQVPEPANALPAGALDHATLRQVVHLSLGGAMVRLRLSNAFGRGPLHVAAVRVAPARGVGSAAIDAAHQRVVTFGGVGDVTLPPGAEYWSDPVALAVPPGADLAVSLSLDGDPDGQTGHPGSRATSFVAPGDQVAAADLAGAHPVTHWYLLSGVDVAAAPDAFSVVAFGDSITDGHGATTDGNDRWPDALAARLAAAGRPVGVLNAGIGGNCLLSSCLGPDALARLDRDVLAQSRARVLILLEGVNDLGGLARTAPASAAAHADLVGRLLAGYAQLVAMARAHGLRVLGATLTPFAGSDYYHPDAATLADRRTINAWIRAPGHFDGVVDFDAAVRDPAHPDHLLPADDCGDHLHPSPAGYRALAAAVPLGQVRPPERLSRK